VIAFLPHILDTGASGRNEYLGTLKALAEKNKRRPFTYVWAEAASQPALEKVLGVGGFGYPALSVVKVEKKRYATMVRAFTQDGVNEFLGRLYSGQEKNK
jgi:protein disulfide-isomerase A6